MDNPLSGDSLPMIGELEELLVETIIEYAKKHPGTNVVQGNCCIIHACVMVASRFYSQVVRDVITNSAIPTDECISEEAYKKAMNTFIDKLRWYVEQEIRRN